MQYTKEYIQAKLSTDIRWIEKAVLVLFERQTDDEQTNQVTRWENGRGFNSSDSRYLTYVSNYLLGGRHLSGRHLEKVASKMPKYWRQILEEIQIKQEVA
jgi:uncharacterized protein (DUF2267 family)